MEEWKIYPELSNYEVSNLGRVRNIKTKRILSKNIDKYEDSLKVYSIELKNLKESNNTLRGINKHFQNNDFHLAHC